MAKSVEVDKDFKAFLKGLDKLTKQTGICIINTLTNVPVLAIDLDTLHYTKSRHINIYYDVNKGKYVEGIRKHEL